MRKIGHAVLNPHGKQIHVTAWTMGYLRKLKLISKDRETGLKRMSPLVWDLLTNPAMFRSLIPSPLRSRGYEPRSRRTSSGVVALYRELGPDCSGTDPVDCRCRECREQMSTGHTPSPHGLGTPR